MFGYDFKKDHQALVTGETPRVDKTSPEKSLILIKPTLLEDHGGGKRMDVDSWQYQLLLRWIANGAPTVEDQKVHLEKLTFKPSSLMFSKAGNTAKLQVLATWSDRTVEDVTAITVFRSNDDSLATVSPAGLVTSLKPGDTDVVALYDNGTTSLPVLLPYSETSSQNYPQLRAATKIDELVQQKLKLLNIVPSDLCTDAEFLRRVSIDLTGTLPTPTEVRGFLTDSSLDKRKNKINELLERPAYAAWWTTKLCDMMDSHRHYQPIAKSRPIKQWHDWVFRRVQNNTSYDKIVRGIIVSSSRRPGETYEDYLTSMSAYHRHENAADFSLRDTMPYYWQHGYGDVNAEKSAIQFAHSFLGIRLQCAQCHKHPFDRWTKQNFVEFSDFFRRIEHGYTKPDKQLAQMLGDKYTWTEHQIRVGEGKVYPWKEIIVKKTVSSADGKAKQSIPEYLLKRSLKKLISQAKEDLKQKSNSGEAAEVAAARDKVSLYQNARIAQLEILVEKNLKVVRENHPVIQEYRRRIQEIRQDILEVSGAKLLAGVKMDLQTVTDPRESLMTWLEAPDNPYFSMAFVNRVWAHYFGRGVIEPPDDLNLANPPSNAPLLKYLEQSFRQNHFDMKWLHREILNSDAYQRSWKPNSTNAQDIRNFSHAKLRMMPGEVLDDALRQSLVGSKEMDSLKHQVEGRSISYVRHFHGHRQKQMGAYYALTIFGKPKRETSCDCERTQTVTFLQSVYLMNDGTIHSLLRKSQWIQDVSKGTENYSTEDLVKETYLRTLNRFPDERELSKCVQHLKKHSKLSEGLKDLMWALLNTKEFLTIK